MPSAELASDTNVVIVGWNDATSLINSVTDSAGNVYQVAAPLVRGTKLSQAVYYAANIKAAAAGANRVTVVFSQSASVPDVRVLEYSGLDPASPLDGVVSGSGSSSSANSGTVATSGASDLLVGGGTTQTFFSAAGGGFTKRVITSPDGDIAEDRSVTAAGNYNATASLGASGAWVMQLVAFKAASGGTTTTTTTTTAPSNPGVPVFRQQASALPVSGQNVTATFAGAETSGDTDVVVVGWNDVTASISSVTDSAGNVYQVAAPLVRGTKLSQAIYYAANIKAAAAGANRVTVVFSQSASVPDVRVLEYGGLDPSVPFDVAGSGSGSSSSAASSQVVTSSANELLVGAGTTQTFSRREVRTTRRG